MAKPIVAKQGSHKKGLKSRVQVTWAHLAESPAAQGPKLKPLDLWLDSC